MKMSNPQLRPLEVLVKECYCFTVNYFDGAELKAEGVKDETGSCDNFVLQ